MSGGGQGRLAGGPLMLGRKGGGGRGIYIYLLEKVTHLLWIQNKVIGNQLGIEIILIF